MKIVIEGAGAIGAHLAKLLSREANEISVIDADSDRLARLADNADVITIHGNASSIKVLKSAGVHNADLFISVTPFTHQDVNIVSALIAKNLGARRVIARVDDEDLLSPENKLMFKEMGIELMFYPEKIAADEIVDQLRHTASSDTMEFAHGKLQIVVFKLEEDSSLLDLTLKEFVEQAGREAMEQFRIIAIARGDHTIIPKTDTRFLFHDLVFIITRREGLPLLINIFGRSNLKINRVMILGGSTTGQLTASALCGKLEDIKLIERDRGKCVYLTEKLPNEVNIVCGDGRNTDFLAEEGIRNYDAFVALSGSDETNVLTCVVAKKLGVGRAIAEVENLEYIHLAEEMGVDVVINKKLLTAGRIFKFTLSGRARFVKYMNGTEAEVLEYTVAPKSLITQRPLAELGFPKNAIVGGVIRGNDGFIAKGDTQLEAYDRVAVFALPDVVAQVDKFFK